MAGEVNVTIIGSTTGAAELRFVPSGRPVCTWTTAVNPRRFDKQRNEWVELDAQFYRCSVWGDQAEHVAESLHRPGIRVIVTGQLNPRQYESDGVKKLSLEINVDEVGPSLRWTPVSVPEKSARQGGGGARPAQQPAAADPWATGPSGGAGYPATDEPPF